MVNQMTNSHQTKLRKRGSVNYQYQERKTTYQYNSMNVKKIIRKWRDLYTNNFENLDKIDKFIKKHNLPKLTPSEIKKKSRRVH